MTTGDDNSPPLGRSTLAGELPPEQRAQVVAFLVLVDRPDATAQDLSTAAGRRPPVLEIDEGDGAPPPGSKPSDFEKPLEHEDPIGFVLGVGHAIEAAILSGIEAGLAVFASHSIVSGVIDHFFDPGEPPPPPPPPPPTEPPDAGTGDEEAGTDPGREPGERKTVGQPEETVEGQEGDSGGGSEDGTLDRR
jgi:hypothetical protein